VVETGTDTGPGPTDTEAAPPPDDNGFLGWFALVLAVFRGETATGGTPPTTVDTVPTETFAPEPEPESDMPWGWIVLALLLGRRPSSSGSCSGGAGARGPEGLLRGLERNLCEER
jgi:hypothetical protein